MNRVWNDYTEVSVEFPFWEVVKTRKTKSGTRKKYLPVEHLMYLKKHEMEGRGYILRAQYSTPDKLVLQFILPLRH